MNVIKEFLNYINLEKALAFNTILGYKSDLIKFEKFAEKPILEIVEKDFVKYLKYLRFNFKEKTYMRKLSVLKSFFKYLEENNYLKNPPQIINSKSKSSKYIPRYFSEQEIDEIVKFIEKNCKNLVDIVITKTLIYTGARISEVLNIRLSDIDFENKFLKIIGKGQKSRIIPILDEHIIILKKYIKNSNITSKSEKIFNITRNNFWNRLDNYSKLIGLNKKIHPHMFRHSLATNMLNHGADLRYVQEILGHSNVKTTEIYTHVSKNKLKSLYDKAFND